MLGSRRGTLYNRRLWRRDADPRPEVARYNVKAALLLNFSRFIEWPDSAFPDARAPINVCVFGANPFGDSLERALQGETIGNRTLAARQVKSSADAAGCHLLFVPSGAESRASAMVHQHSSYAVTVGESRKFEDMGGAVNLVLEDGRVRFNVNLQPVERRGDSYQRPHAAVGQPRRTRYAGEVNRAQNP